MSSQRRTASIGDRELALLRFVSDRRTSTVAQAVEGYGAPIGLARSTVLTMMERLRRKGHLTRRHVGGVYHYQPRTTPGVAARQAVERFIDRTLGGSITPLVAYLGERTQVSEAELEELEALLERLQSTRRQK